MGRIKINKKFRPLWTSDCTTFIITGGRGSGKSFAVGDFIENLSFEKGHKILYTRYALNTASDSIIPEFEHKIDLEGHGSKFYVTKTDVINRSTGCVINFRGIKTSSGNQTAKLKSIEGLTTWVLEEAEELDSQETYNTIRQSVRSKTAKNRIILVLNPKSKEHWIYKEFFESRGVDPGFCGEHDGVCYIHTTYLENLQNLSDSFLEDAERAKKYTPNLYAYDYLGEWVLSVEDAIFKDNKLNRYSVLNDEGVDLCYIDTADEGSDHFAAIFGRLVGNKFYVYDAIFNLQNLTVNEAICKERFERHEVDQVYIESNSFGAYFIRNLRRENENVPIAGINSKANKMGRILAESGYIMEFFYFPEQPNEELSKFMRELTGLTPDMKDKDDAADCTAGISARIKRDYIR